MYNNKLEIKVHEVVTKLQDELGLRMWLAQSQDTQVSIWKEVPIMNIVPYLRGGDCYYSLNLRTGRPTAKSPSQIQLSKELIAMIRSQARTHGFFG